MNGAESLLRTLVGSGVEVCFGNPGTSEMHFVAALDRVEGMRVVLGLFEGAVTGMADGYGRIGRVVTNDIDYRRRCATRVVEIGKSVRQPWSEVQQGRGRLLRQPHDHLALTGGAIGQGIPVATGAAVACPDRKVVCLHGDGGAMYTPQALWTQARESLDVTTVVFANRSYAILNIELARVGAGDPGPKVFSMLDLHNPELDWVKLASGMGVEASRATSVEEFATQFASAMKGHGPRLIEVVL